MAAVSPTLFSRSMCRRRSAWLTLVVCLALLALPFLVTTLDGALDEVIANGFLRLMLLPPVVISYILLVAPAQVRGEADMVRRLRPVVLVDDVQFAEVVAQASRINPVAEIGAALAGAAVGFALGHGWGVGTDTLSGLYVLLSLPAMFAVLSWTIYDSLMSTRLLAALHRLPLLIDLLDTSPFEPIGRQALVGALVFLGGIGLGIIFGLDPASITLWRAWMVYAPLALIAVLLFFLNMRDTHRVLSAAKAQELDAVGRRLQQAGASLRRRLPDGEIPAGEAVELAALLAYERRIRGASTWPYNPTMMQTLMFSILLPILVKAITWFLFDR